MDSKIVNAHGAMETELGHQIEALCVKFTNSIEELIKSHDLSQIDLMLMQHHICQHIGCEMAGHRILKATKSIKKRREKST